MGLRNFFDRIEPNFTKGGKYEKYFPIYEMVESFIYTPKTVTTVAPHARSYVDMKRIMTYVVIATIPCILWGMYNTGYQANSAIAALGPDSATGWRIALLQMFGISLNPASVFGNFMHGLLYFLPIYITTLVAGGIFEVIFATVRGHEVNEGFLVSSMLYTLILPASTPLVAGRAGDHLWRGHRQRSLWRHGQELPQPCSGGSCFPVFRLSGQHVRRQRLDSGGWLFRRDGAVGFCLGRVSGAGI